MYLTEIKINPLPAIFKLLEVGQGIPLLPSSLEALKDLLNMGGVVAENEAEVVHILSLFCSEYKLTSIIQENNTYYLRKVDGCKTA